MSLAVTTPIAGLGVFAVKEAANMEGAMSKFNVVFKGGTEEMLMLRLSLCKEWT